MLSIKSNKNAINTETGFLLAFTYVKGVILVIPLLI